MGACRDETTVIEEIGLSGESVSLGKCCKKTMQNWVNDINDSLTRNHYEWRVVGRMEDGCGIISPITKERFEAVSKLR